MGQVSFFKKRGETVVRRGLVGVRPSVWRFALALSGNPDRADELTQATCLRALEKAQQFQPGTKLEAWCLTICRSLWLNDRRAAAIRQMGQLDGYEHTLVDPASSAEARVFADEVFQAVMSLPEALRVTTVLVFVEGYAYREAAEILGVPIGTVMSRLATARKKLATLNEDADAACRESV